MRPGGFFEPARHTVDCRAYLALQTLPHVNLALCAAPGARTAGKDVDISSLKGVVSFNDGPYVEDWSKVPAEIAAKYNTAPR